MKNSLLSSCLFALLLSVPCAAEKADLVVVEKAKHELTLLNSGKVIRKFHVVFGAEPVGHKQMEGDNKTPEGRYLLDFKKADSAFYKAFHVSYPNAQDVAKANSAGVHPGSNIMVHGQKNGFGWASAISQQFNWTQGCIAMTNADMDAMWELVDAGTAIDIRP